MIYIGDNIYEPDERTSFAKWVDYPKLKGDDSSCPAAKYAKEQQKLAQEKKDLEAQKKEFEEQKKKLAATEEANRLQNEENQLMEEQTKNLTRKNMTISGIIY